MNRKRLEWLPLMKKRLMTLIYVLGFFLAVWGSVLIYWTVDRNLWEKVTNTIASVIKLYLFMPSPGSDGSFPWPYELAIWITPISTVSGFLNIGQKYLKRFQSWLYHLNRKHLVVMGDRAFAEPFLREAFLERPKDRLLYLAKSMEEQHALEGVFDHRIKIATIDCLHPENIENALLVRKYKIHQAEALIVFEGEPENFRTLRAINEILEDKCPERIPTHVMSTNTKMKELIEDQADHLKALSIHYFNLDHLRAIELFQREDFRAYETKGLKEAWTKEDVENEMTMAKKIGHAHLLIVGFTALGQEIFKEATNLLTLNPSDRLHITILDKNAKEQFDYFESDIDQLEKVCRVDILPYDLRAKALPQALSKAIEEDPLTSVVFTIDSAKESLVTIERFRKLFSDGPVSLYTPKRDEVSALLDAIKEKLPNIVTFGEEKDLLTREVILRDRFLRKAKAFNAFYNETAAKLMGWEIPSKTSEEQWNELTSFKRESSLAQSLHAPIKRAILEKLTSIEGFPNTRQEIVDEWKKELQSVSVTEEVSIIEKSPVKNFFTELEHRRWNNFHYMRNFHFSETKDLENKEHDCLIDSWEEFLQGPQREKAIYDYISTLSVE
ncbi:hypothetical protein [Guggenheimella bovis]